MKWIGPKWAEILQPPKGIFVRATITFTVEDKVFSGSDDDLGIVNDAVKVLNSEFSNASVDFEEYEVEPL